MEAQLAIEINEQRMSAYRIVDETLELIQTSACVNRTDAGYKETLQQLLLACGDMNAFDSYTCSYSSAKYTLVPMALFENSKPNDIINFTINGEVSKSDTDYNRIFEWSLVNVYYLPMWIKSVLVMKIPRIVVQHEVSHALRQLNVGSTYGLKTQIILQESSFSCIIRKDGIIGHSSYQAFQTAEDIVYHLLYCFQQMNTTTKGEITISGGTTELSNVGKELIVLLKKIKTFETQKIVNTTYDHIKYQKLCV